MMSSIEHPSNFQSDTSFRIDCLTAGFGTEACIDPSDETSIE